MVRRHYHLWLPKYLQHICNGRQKACQALRDFKRKGNIYNTCLLALRDFKSSLLEMKEYYGPFHLYTGYCEVMEPDLAFLEMFFQGLAYWEDLEYDWHLRFSISTMMTALIRVIQEFDGDCDREYLAKESMNWEVVMYDYKKTFQRLEAQARDICILLVSGAYKCASCPSNQKRFLEYVRDTEKFTDFILQSLRSLQSSRLMAPALKQKIHLIQRGLEEFRMFVDPPKILFDLISRNRAWIIRISCLTYLFWIDRNDENLASAMETMLSGLLHEITPCRSSGVVSSFVQYAKNLQPLMGYLELLLQDLVIPMKDEVYEGMIFLLSFVINSQSFADDSKMINLEDSKMIWAQSFAAIKKFTSLIYSLGYGETEGGFCAVDPSDFLVTVDTVKARLRNLYVVAPYSSEFPSPSTNVIGFLNSMIGNLNEMLQQEINCIPSLKHQGELLQEELRPLVRNTTEQLIDEDEEMRDLWTDISCTVHNADYFIRLSHIKSLSVWYGIAGLSFLKQDIESVKRKIDKLVGVDRKSSGHHDPVEGADVLQPRGTTSENEVGYMGFIKDKKVIIDDLTRGSNSLTIISISGSGGQGKTTLAKQIYNDPNVQYHFHKRGWCYISKDCPIKEILVQIIGDVNKGDDRKNNDTQNKRVHELDDHLRKSLKGRRYFIVMDDIWDVDIWRKLESSFPDDMNGSRILFTSRNHDLASQAKSNSISHPLPLFTDEESWKLMKKRVFGSHMCDEEFLGIGKKIASYCKGLPLAVSLTAAVLGRTQQSLDSWNKVAGNLKRHLAEEGCGNVLKLSYTHLPEYLKSCFLYFRTFRKGEEVRAKELKLLWVGEGFVIPNGEDESRKKDLATKYLKDLASQGLVGVTEWGTLGGIKRCSVHDLLYDMCWEICKEDNYLTWVALSNCYGNALDLKSVNGHRVQIGLTSPFISSTPSTKRALAMSPLYSLTYANEYLFPIRHFRSFKLLTVLNLKKTGAVQDIFLEVTSLIHLRYLAINFWNYITAIPLEIANLWKLGALILKLHTGGTTLLPVSMWNRKSLRHVDIQRARLNLDEFDLGEPDKLFGGALYLEALGSLYLDVDDSRTTEFLGNFPNLRKLRCELNKGTGKIMKLLSMVGSLLPHLESLTVAVLSPRDVLYSEMENPNRNPILWSLHENQNLIKLSLGGIPWSVVSEIGKRLPNLRVFKLLDLSRVEKRWKLEDGDFPKLIYLRLSSLRNLEEIDVSICVDLPFPCLEHLVLVNCAWLKEIPSIFEEHSTLKRIKVSDCSQEVKDSAIRILKQQRDEIGNESFEVMINGTIKDEYYNSEEEDETEKQREFGNESFELMFDDPTEDAYYDSAEEDETDEDECYDRF